MSVLTDLKQRGVEDLLITCVDGLAGFDTAIANVFPAATVQLCIVHQLRNSFRFIPDKHLKEFVVDIKTVYQAPSADQGRENLVLVEQKWGSRYPQAVQSWVAKWALLCPYFDFPAAVRKVMYTTAPAARQHGGRLSSAVTKGDQDKRGLLLGSGFAEVGLSDDPKSGNQVGKDNSQLEGGIGSNQHYL